MYTEEPRRTLDWGDIIKKGLLIVLIALVIFFVIWLFTRNNNINSTGNSNNIMVDDGSNTTNNSTAGTISNPETYSQVFISNYRYFHDTAKEYFLISELPQDGSSIKYTLQQLIDKGLILPFGYQNGESCDQEASYVTVTNVDKTYRMTVTLVCGREVAKTTEQLGCNQLCNNNCNANIEDNNSATTNVLEYRFKQAYQAAETVYTCPSGYTRSGSKCVKDNATTVKATKNVTYTCPAGYEKTGSGSNTKCTKDSSTSVDATKVTNYSCPSGYEKYGTGASTMCTKTSDVFVNPTYTYEYTCPSGYTKSGSGTNTKCTKTSTTTVSASAETEYHCPAGYTRSGSGASTKCTKTVFTNDVKNATATTTYSCPSGYTKSGSGASTKCTKTVTSASQSATPSKSYSCSSGTNLGNGKCRVYSTTTTYKSYTMYYGKTYNGCTYSGSYTDSCSSYYGCTRTYYKYYCPKTSYTDKSATVTYTCPSGYTKSGSGASTKCTKSGTTSTQTATPTASTTYSCPSGYTKSGSGASTKCTSTSSVSGSQTATPTTETNYYCSEGTLTSGNRCQITKTVTANYIKNATAHCDSDYEVLSDGRCYKPISEKIKPTTTTSYSCPAGFTKDGNKCVSTGTSTERTIKNTTYTCPSGYTKVGSGSEAKCTKGTTSSIPATKSTRNVTKYRYKWSTETSLSGWDRTGETRNKTVTSLQQNEVIEK